MFRYSAITLSLFLFPPFFCGQMTLEGKSDLEYLIPGEVKNDDFYKVIFDLSRTEPVATILEIGSSSGDGSTEAFVKGIIINKFRPTLFCMEVSNPRFLALKSRYRNVAQVKSYNVSSVPLSSFPTENDIIAFYQTTPTNLNGYPLETILRWLKQDIDYVSSSGVNQNGIELIKKENGIKEFDIVLIDGSEFTGIPEFDLIYGAKWILLDDICAYKNFINHGRLLNDPNYVLIKENRHLRNGYSVFKRRD